MSESARGAAAQKSCETRAPEATLHSAVSFSVPLALPEAFIDAIAQRVAAKLAEGQPGASATRFMSVPEAAEYLRCKRQRIDDLLSQRRLTRYKEHGRTLVLRAEVEGLAEISHTRIGALRAV